MKILERFVSTMAMPSGGDKHDTKTKSSFRIFCNLFIAFVGAGILGLPFAFKEAGLVEGCVIMLAVGFISSKAMILLINCKEKILSSDEYYQQSPSRSPETRFGSPLKKFVKMSLTSIHAMETSNHCFQVTTKKANLTLRLFTLKPHRRLCMATWVTTPLERLARCWWK